MKTMTEDSIRSITVGRFIFGFARSVSRDGWAIGERKLPFVWAGRLNDGDFQAIRVVIGDWVFGVYWFNE